MASTSLFAPQVRAVQPAFVYKNNSGEVKIYFSLSAYNNENDFDKIYYTLVDPNKASTWGTNSVLAAATRGVIEKANLSFNEINKEYSFSIVFDNNFKTLTTNQFYQMQLFLAKNGPDATEPEKGETVSLGSQVTLIRPIDEPSVEIELEGTVTAAAAKKIVGHLKYEGVNPSIETLAEYSISIADAEKVVFAKNNIENLLGLDFEYIVPYNFEEGATYNLIFKGTTINGYEIPAIQKSFNIKDYSSWAKAEDNEELYFSFINSTDTEKAIRDKFYVNPYSGSVELKVEVKLPAEGAPAYIILQKSNEKSNFKIWEKVAIIETANIALNKQFGLQLSDYQVEGDYKEYQYRFLFCNTLDASDNTGYISNTYAITVTFEDIYLSNRDKQIVIRYNPNITGFKWVTQDSITNTLGGVYPIFRRNGLTKYRQFSLSGTIYTDPDALFSNKITDSRSDFSMFMGYENEGSLLLSVEDAFNQNHSTNWDNKSEQAKINIYERRFRDAAMAFLTDGKPKVFRSAEEGLMIVVLNGVSFTPNKTLSRQVYDFSATVTEIAEVNEENLARYGLSKIFEKLNYVYRLSADSIIEDGSTYFVTPYLSVEEGYTVENEKYYLLLEPVLDN